MNKHLVFYDGTCGLCDHVVQFLLKHDSQEIYLFAPLQGATAAQTLKELPTRYKTLDSLILLENYATHEQKPYVLGQGAFRILWLLGGSWRLLGWPFFLPAFLYNWGYRLVAKNRKRFFQKESCVLLNANNQHRFLP